MINLIPMTYYENERNYTINSKVNFISNVNVSIDDQFNCLKFCWDMTIGQKGKHRANRTGGMKKRKPMDIFCDAFIGKMGEVAFHHFCEKRNIAEVSDIDYECTPLGKWDDTDFTIKNKKTGGIFKIAIKTTKNFGNLLLLEQKDWEINREGKVVYMPNKNNHSKGVYDFLVFCRVKTNLSNIVDKELFKKEDAQGFLNQTLRRLLVELQVVGYVRNSDLVEMINSNNFLIKQGDRLNRKTVMDASNYYIQSGSFKQFE